MNQQHKEAEVRMVYAAELMRKGWSRTEIVKHCQDKYGVSYTAALRYCTKAINYLMKDDSSKFIDKVRKKQEERTEYILRKAIEAEDWHTANKILDNYNKLLGLYETKQKIELTSNEIQFKFGGIDNEASTEVDEPQD
jgi:hypothetical protein